MNRIIHEQEFCPSKKRERESLRELERERERDIYITTQDDV